MKLLTVSDIVLPPMENSQNLARNYHEAEAVISCGDMPISYLDLITSALPVPLMYVRGNHDIHYTDYEPGGDNLHLTVRRYKDYLFAGLEGCIKYSREPVEYTESEMFVLVLRLWPRVLLARARWKRRLDVMVTHSPARDIHDLPDYAHRGFRSFRLMLNLYQPRYMLHGHVDTNDSRRPTRTHLNGTEIININPVKYLDLA
jgi:Icc-related predicted phosphoesterase